MCCIGEKNGVIWVAAVILLLVKSAVTADWSSSQAFDYDGNGIIGLGDFAVFASNWGQIEPDLPGPGITWAAIIDEGFVGRMSVYETTNQQYCQYLNSALAQGLIAVFNGTVYSVSDTTRSRPFCYTLAVNSESQIIYADGIFSVRERDGHSMADYPMVTVSQNGAAAFCDYYGYKLPTSQQWQAAADYDGSYIYGCGTTITQSIANYNYSNPIGLSSSPRLSPVGYYGTFGYGLADLAGNVWEWTDYAINNGGLLLGGAWNDQYLNCDILRPTTYALGHMSSYVGFRACIPAMPFDYHYNGIIGSGDLIILASHWGQMNPEIIKPDITWQLITDPGFAGWMSVYETTNAQFAKYLNSALKAGDIQIDGSLVKGSKGTYTDMTYYELNGLGYTGNGGINGGKSRISFSDDIFTVESGFENHPVTYVSRYGAAAFAEYYGWYLPTQYQWQAVADYDGSYNYGTGININNSIANYFGTPHLDGTTEVGSFGTYGYGIADMAGNVWEWTNTANGSNYISRGGCWTNMDYACSVSSSYSDNPNGTYFDVGFRVCR